MAWPCMTLPPSVESISVTFDTPWFAICDSVAMMFCAEAGPTSPVKDA